MKKNAFTLIEIMVAVAIFAVFSGAFVGFFIASIQAQKKVLASQALIDNVSFNLEYISRAIRMARKELSDPPICLSSRGLNYEKTQDGKGLKFINYDGICQEFFWNDSDERLYESKRGETPIPLTSANLEIISFQLGLDDSWGQEQEPPTQPKVTLFLELKRKGQGQEPQPSISIQTTVSQRNLNVRY